MIRRTALALAVSVAACAPVDGAPEEPLGEAEQAETLTDPSTENAIRFLEQATFGPRLTSAASPAIDTVQYVEANGITKAIEAQIAKTAPMMSATSDLGGQFFVSAIDGEDQLRLRVAFALSQILVVSEAGIPDDNTTTTINESRVGTAGYFNKLRAGAFGSFRALLETITRDPAMGHYLNMANNRAFDSTGARILPNENFARELLQLFTLGLVKLNPNGTPKMDCNGDGVADAGCTTGMTLPAYTEAQVQAFAAALSGWTFAKTAAGTAATDCPAQGGRNGRFFGTGGACATTGQCGKPMIACNVNHDSRQQTLLRGVKTTDKGTAEQHLTEALDNIAGDPNVAPFIVKQLIQHLVTSNPSPAYVKRVVDVWTASTGNLGSVVKAILEDSEARGPQAPLAYYAQYGRLRPPALFITSLVRWLDGHLDTTAGKTPGSTLNTASRDMGQQALRPPSVFSYYPPDYVAPGGSGLLGPEFSILTTATVATRANFVNSLLFGTSYANAGVVINVNVLPDDAEGMVLWLEQNMLHHAASADLQLAIYGAITDARANTVAKKKKLAINLAALSPELQIQR